MQYIGIFNGNPTAGGTDGSEVSQDGVQSNPIGANVAAGQTQVVTCAVRCESGYTVNGNTGIMVMSYNPTQQGYEAGSDYIKVSASSSGPFSNAIELAGVNTTNTLFYVQLTGQSAPGTVIGALQVSASISAA